MEDGSVDLVLNLTLPQAHVPVGLRAVDAAKHVYSEKPLGLSVAEAKSLLEAARSHGVRIGCAPDTFLGAGQQTARQLIDQGAIGTPIGGRPSSFCLVMNVGIPTRPFSTRSGAARSLTWGLITSQRW